MSTTGSLAADKAALRAVARQLSRARGSVTELLERRRTLCLRLSEAGLSQVEIADLAGVTDQQVANDLAKANGKPS